MSVITLPRAPEQYDVRDQNNLRRLVEQALGTAEQTAAAKAVEIVNALDSGAKGDGTIDDWAILQGMADALFDATYPTQFDNTATLKGFLRYQRPSKALGQQVLYLPPTRAADAGDERGYQISRPLWISTPGTTLRGGRAVHYANLATRIRPTYKYGPAVVFHNGQERPLPLAASLATGAGNSLRLVGTEDRFYNLRDARTMDLNGLSAFAVELFFKPSSLSGDFNTIVGSGGRWFTEEASNTAFYLRLTTAGTTLQFAIKTSVSGTVTVTDTVPLVVGTAYHIAGTYDGTTVRLFKNGALVASAAATGTLVQADAEDVCVGKEWLRTPAYAGNSFTNPAPGDYDSIRISNTARYTAAFTAPTAKFASDANTLLLMNFDLHNGPISRFFTRDGDFWCWYFEPGGSYGVGGWVVEDIFISGVGQNEVSGVYVGAHGYFGQMKRCSLYRLRTGAVITAFNGYPHHVEHLRVNISSSGASGKSRYGLLVGKSSGLSHYDTVQVFGGLVPVYAMHGSVLFSNCYIQQEPGTVFGAILTYTDFPGSSYCLHNVVFNAENGVDSGFRAALGIGNELGSGSLAGVNAHGCTFENFSTGAPHILAESSTMSIFEACAFAVNTNHTQIATTVGATAMARPVVFNLCHQLLLSPRTTRVPWSTTKQNATATEPGLIVVPFSATPVFDASKGSTFDITLTGNVTSSTLINASPGQALSWIIRQDATGGRSYVWPTTVVDGANIVTGANGVTGQAFVYEGTNARAVSSGAPTLPRPLVLTTTAFETENDLERSLGSASKRWANAHINDLTLYSGFTLQAIVPQLRLKDTDNLVSGAISGYFELVDSASAMVTRIGIDQAGFGSARWLAASGFQIHLAPNNGVGGASSLTKAFGDFVATNNITAQGNQLEVNPAASADAWLNLRATGGVAPRYWRLVSARPDGSFSVQDITAAVPRLNLYKDGDPNILELLDAGAVKFRVDKNGNITGGGASVTSLDAGNILTGVLAVARGGTGAALALVAEDVILGASATTMKRLAVGANDKVLGVSGGLVAWVDPPIPAGVVRIAGDTMTGALVINSGVPQLVLNQNMAAGFARLGLYTATTKRNWVISAQDHVDQALEITPSTVDGGTTFTTPVFQLSSLGALTLAAGLTATTGKFSGNIGEAANRVPGIFIGTTGIDSTGPLTATMLNATTSGVLANLNNTAAAGLNGIIGGQRGGVVRYYIGFDASDNFAVLNNIASAAILTLTNAGALTLAAGLTAASGTFAGALTVSGDLARPFLIAKSTVAVSAPGAGIGLLRWEAGTNAGTLKLVAYAGTSTTGVTIIDNVGAGS